MDRQALLEKLFQPVGPAALVLAGAGILAAVYMLPQGLGKVVAQERLFQKSLQGVCETVAAARERIVSLETLKALDAEQLKSGIGGHAQSQKSLFESGLSLQEERRLLEKQLEIMTTYLLINPSLGRVFLMREEQPLQSYLIAYIPLRAFGEAPTALPAVVRIVSKERFAHPERGASEQVNGVLVWEPPQVGTSVRSNALGEFVMFTNSKLILHGPPVDAEDHERFPHVCIGLDRDAARKLYRASFIGTKIALEHASIDTTPMRQALTPGTTPGN